MIKEQIAESCKECKYGPRCSLYADHEWERCYCRRCPQHGDAFMDKAKVGVMICDTILLLSQLKTDIDGIKQRLDEIWNEVNDSK